MRTADLADLASVLSAPKRVEILRALGTYKGGVKVKELAEIVGLQAPTVTHHLKILAAADLVEYSQISTSRYYQVVIGATYELAEAIKGLTSYE